MAITVAPEKNLYAIHPLKKQLGMYRLNLSETSGMIS